MLLLTKMPRRVLLLCRLRIARDRQVARTHEAAERQRAWRRLLVQAEARVEQP
jgi:hypothetical protein